MIFSLHMTRYIILPKCNGIVCLNLKRNFIPVLWLGKN